MISGMKLANIACDGAIYIQLSQSQSQMKKHCAGNTVITQVMQSLRWRATRHVKQMVLYTLHSTVCSA